MLMHSSRVSFMPCDAPDARHIDEPRHLFPILRRDLFDWFSIYRSGGSGAEFRRTSRLHDVFYRDRTLVAPVDQSEPASGCLSVDVDIADAPEVDVPERPRDDRNAEAGRNERDYSHDLRHFLVQLGPN